MNKKSLSSSDPFELDPKAIRFTQSTISKTFQNGNPVEGLVSDLKKGNGNYKNIPPIRVFVLHDFDKDKNIIYSLDNRRLYALKKSYSDKALVCKANLQDIFTFVEKFSCQKDDEYYLPKMTVDKNINPSPRSITIGKFRKEMEKLYLAYYASYCTNKKKIDENERNMFIFEKLKQKMKGKFNL